MEPTFVTIREYERILEFVGFSNIIYCIKVPLLTT